MISQNQNKYMKKLIVLFVISMMLFGFNSAKAYTVNDLYRQLETLKTQVDSLKADLSALVLNAVKTVAPVKTIAPAVLSTTKTILPTIVAPTLTPTKTETPTINKAPVVNTLQQLCIPQLSTPWIKVSGPNGGETYQAGQQVTVTWTTCNIPSTEKVNILLEAPYLSNFSVSLIDHTFNDGTETITLPNSLPTYGTLFQVKVLRDSTLLPHGAPLYPDISDNFFTIQNPLTLITVVSPNGGETYTPGQSIVVTWDSAYIPPSALVNISLEIPLLGTSIPLATNTVNDGTENILLPNTLPAYGTIFKVKIIQANGPTFDLSDNLFTIQNPLPCTPNTWTRKADFGGTARQGAIGFSIGNKGYMGTGEYTNDLWEFTPGAGVMGGTWTQKAYFGGTVVRGGAVGFSIGTNGYVATGYGGIINTQAHPLNDFWKFDSINNVWTQLGNFPGTARYSAVSFSIGTKGYVGTGYGTQLLKDFWEYDSNNDTWTQKADFGGTARRNAVGFSIGNKGYIGTGSDGNGIGRKDFWEYNPTTNIWTQKADVGGVARTNATGFSIGTKGYLGTGNTGGVGGSDFWEYDAIAGVWTQRADFGGTGRGIATGFSIGGRGYIGAGEGYDPITQTGLWKDFWEYCPS